VRDSAPTNLARRRWLHAAAGGSLLAGAAAQARPRPPAGTAPTLQPVLRGLLAGSGLPAQAVGLCIQSVQAQALPLAGHNADQLYQLASTAKVVTTLAALDLLGPRYRWRTAAFLMGPLDDGHLDGDLLILGGGDALLRSEHLLAWFRQMQTDGLREVRGDILLDRMAFRLTPADLASTPTPGPDRPHHAWPDALMLDEGRQSLRVDLRAGARPQQALAPLGALWREAGGRLRGRVVAAPSVAPSTPRAAADQPSWPTGPDGRVRQPFSVHRSEPLPLLVRDINKTSDNLAARNLMLSMAPGFPLKAATLPGARERVQAWLRLQGLGRGDILVDSGAGLSRLERGKPRALVHLLRRAWQGPQRDPFVQSLPVAGVDGTLAHRMTRGQATGRAFLKTGTLLDTRALAGYVLGRGGTVYALAALVNHEDAQRATPMLDQLVEWLAHQG
jgi:serine-type D-Ala-D-Ala carboxypeptidase/endopeptidase (penicillin-binding protein 4)